MKVSQGQSEDVNINRIEKIIAKQMSIKCYTKKFTIEKQESYQKKDNELGWTERQDVPVSQVALVVVMVVQIVMPIMIFYSMSVDFQSEERFGHIHLI